MGAGDEIFLIGEDGELTELEGQPYATEDILQSLLERHPKVLAGSQINSASPRRFLLISRETPVADHEGGSGRWSLDHLFVDQDAIPTLVEVKRSSDTRIRREVVGQMLDYAANAIGYWHIDTLIASFNQTCRDRDQDPNEILSEFLQDEAKLIDGFWGTVKTNLQAGKVRLLFVADEIPDELKQIVEFLNKQMDPAEVLALEIRQYVSGDLKTLIPRILGQTMEAKQRKSGTGSPRRKWDETSFFEHAESALSPENLVAVRKFYEFSKNATEKIVWGTSMNQGSFNPKFEFFGTASPYSVFSGGKFQCNFGWGDEVTDGINAFKARLKEAVELATGYRFPEEWQDQLIGIEPGTWCPQVDGLISTLQALINEYR